MGGENNGRDQRMFREFRLSRTERLFSVLVYDASVKIPVGLITGNHKQLGNYDECLRVNSDRGFVGQACQAFVQFVVAANDGKPRELDLGDLLVNVAIASVSLSITR